MADDDDNLQLSELEAEHRSRCPKVKAAAIRWT